MNRTQVGCSRGIHGSINVPLASCGEERGMYPIVVVPPADKDAKLTSRSILVHTYITDGFLPLISGLTFLTFIYPPALVPE